MMNGPPKAERMVESLALRHVSFDIRHSTLLELADAEFNR